MLDAWAAPCPHRLRRRMPSGRQYGGGSPPPGPTRQRRLHVSRCPRTDLTVRLHRRVLLYPRPDGRPRRSAWIQQERDHDPRKRTTIRGGDRGPCGLRFARCALSADPAALRRAGHVAARWIRLPGKRGGTARTRAVSTPVQTAPTAGLSSLRADRARLLARPSPVPETSRVPLAPHGCHHRPPRATLRPLTGPVLVRLSQHHGCTLGDAYREEESMSRMRSAPSSPDPDHRRHQSTRQREDQPRQVSGMSREQQRALIEEARAARTKEQHGPKRD
jgi:hypothetical protein